MKIVKENPRVWAVQRKYYVGLGFVCTMYGCSDEGGSLRKLGWDEILVDHVCA
jgi:hypothetical protein